MTVSFCVGPRQPRSTSPSYRGRPAIIFGSAFVVPAVAETEQVSPAHGQPDLHRDRFEYRRFPVSDEQPAICGHFRGSNTGRAVSVVNEGRPEAVWGLWSLASEIRFPVRGEGRGQRL